MNLERVGAQDAARAYLQQTDANGPPAASGLRDHKSARPHHSRRDSVNVSDNARSLSNAREAVRQSPDIRQDKVADIKQRVTDGTYAVPARVLARRMLGADQNLNPQKS
jgi:flagellar biosynthesis anti-sigma factor FlgM